MGIYYLNNGEKGWEEDRLDWSHYEMVMPLVGNNLLPQQIKDNLQSISSPMIADCCTGTGVWAVSVAQELPGAEIWGFDIDTSKFTTTLPPNVRLEYGDVFEPFPEDLHGKFDLVHARFLVSLLRKEDWVPVARNFMSLLRPGGWILWEDTGPFEFRVLPPNPGSIRYTKLNWNFCNAKGMDTRMPATLSTHLERAGFVHLMEREFHTSPLESLERGTKESMLRLAYQSFLGMAASGIVDDMRTETQAKLVVDELRREFDQGAFCSWTLNRVWGNKPM